MYFTLNFNKLDFNFPFTPDFEIVFSFYPFDLKSIFQIIDFHYKICFKVNLEFFYYPISN
jgi:hypothetical protein